jgi:hypothetical protein
MVRRCDGTGGLVLSLLRLGLEEVDDCILHGSTLQMFPALLSAWLLPEDGGASAGAPALRPPVSPDALEAVNGKSRREAEVMRWLAPHLSDRLLRAWQEKQPKITKFLQLEMRRIVAVPFRDMQALMTIMKQPAFGRTRRAVLQRDLEIDKDLTSFRKWLVEQSARKKAARAIVLRRARSVHAESNYFWLSSRQHLCRKWLHNSKRLATLLWDAYRCPGGLWSAGPPHRRDGLVLLPADGLERGVGGTYEDWMLRNAANVINTDAPYPPPAPAPAPAATAASNNADALAVLRSREPPSMPTRSSGLLPACPTPPSDRRTRAAQALLARHAKAANEPPPASAGAGAGVGAAGAAGGEAAAPVAAISAASVAHLVGPNAARHRACNVVTTHIARLRPALSARTRAPFLVGFEPTFASGLEPNKTAVRLLPAWVGGWVR